MIEVELKFHSRYSLDNTSIFFDNVQELTTYYKRKSKRFNIRNDYYDNSYFTFVTVMKYQTMMDYITNIENDIKTELSKFDVPTNEFEILSIDIEQVRIVGIGGIVNE